MENKYNYEIIYNYEIGIHFKENVTLKQKVSIFLNMADYAEDIYNKNIKNKELAIFQINTENILMIKSILNKNSNLIRYFYIENIETEKFI